MKLKVYENTWAKLSDKSAKDLDSSSKFQLSVGIYDVDTFELIGKHYKVKFSKDVEKALGLEKLGQTWFIYYDHAGPNVSDKDKKIKLKSGISVSENLPTKVLLNVPFASQLDNERNPNGSCNVTSLSMVLQYFGGKSYSGYKGYKQLEDFIYDEMIRTGLSRHSPADLATIYNQLTKQLKIDSYDAFDPAATWNSLFTHLAKGFPAITHLYTTSFGHIFPIIGYDLSDETIIVNDPYGDFSDGQYSPRESINSGKSAKYSIKSLIPLGAKDGDFWVHYLRG